MGQEGGWRAHGEGAVAREDVGRVSGVLVVHIINQQPEGALEGRPVPLPLLPRQHACTAHPCPLSTPDPLSVQAVLQ